MLATNPAPVKINGRLTVQASSGNDIVTVTTKLYNGQERTIHLTVTELKEILGVLA